MSTILCIIGFIIETFVPIVLAVLGYETLALMILVVVGISTFGCFGVMMHEMVKESPSIWDM